MMETVGRAVCGLLAALLISAPHQVTAGAPASFGDCDESGGRLLIGTDPPSQGTVAAFDSLNARPLVQFTPYAGFQGGVRVATGDINGDGTPDILVATGPGAPSVSVFNGRNPQHLIVSFFAFNPSFTGGVYVATGDVNGDTFVDIIVAAGAGGGPRVRVFDSRNLTIGQDGQPTEDLYNFLAYDPSFTGGVRVAAGDVTGDGTDDIITGAGFGGGPHVKVFDGLTGQEAESFFAFDTGFTGGIFVAAGDVNSDDTDDVIVGAGAAPGPGGGPHVKVFDGANLSQTLHEFLDVLWPGGVRVASNDADGDGIADIIVAPGPGVPSVLEVYSGRDLKVLHSFFPLGTPFADGLTVAAAGAGSRIFCGFFE